MHFALVHCGGGVRGGGGRTAAFDQSVGTVNRPHSPHQTPLRLRPPQQSQLPSIHRQPRSPLSHSQNRTREAHRGLQRISALGRRRLSGNGFVDAAVGP